MRQLLAKAQVWYDSKKKGIDFMMMLSLLVALRLFAVEMLDTDMSSEDKKKTGVYKLNTQEKAALQQWIDLHYQKRTTPEEKNANKVTGKHPSLDQNLLNGKYVHLNDGSLWNIRPEDVPIVQGWITEVEIVVSQSTNPFFPYKLTNSVTGSTVLARKVDKLPEPPAQEKKAPGQT
jgi:hypothetical protein